MLLIRKIFGTDADTRIRTTDLLPDPVIFVSGFQEVNKNKCFFAFYYLEVHLRQCSKIKSQKEITKQ